MSKIIIFLFGSLESTTTFEQLSRSAMRAYASVQGRLLDLYEQLRKHFDFSQSQIVNSEIPLGPNFSSKALAAVHHLPISTQVRLNDGSTLEKELYSRYVSGSLSWLFYCDVIDSNMWKAYCHLSCSSDRKENALYRQF